MTWKRSEGGMWSAFPCVVSVSQPTPTPNLLWHGVTYLTNDADSPIVKSGWVNYSECACHRMVSLCVSFDWSASKGEAPSGWCDYVMDVASNCGHSLVPLATGIECGEGDSGSLREREWMSWDVFLWVSLWAILINTGTPDSKRLRFWWRETQRYHAVRNVAREIVTLPSARGGKHFVMRPPCMAHIMFSTSLSLII